MMRIVFAVLVLHCVNSANILYIGPLPSVSHYFWNKVLSLELVANGHNVTMLTHDLEKNHIQNYTVITIEGLYEYFQDNVDYDELLLNNSPMKEIFSMPKYYEFTCAFDFKSAAFRQLLNYPKDFKFDLIIFDVTGPVCLYGYIPRFQNPPVIAVSAYVIQPHFSRHFGNPLYASYTPYFSTTFTNKMTFYERTVNFFYTYLDVFLHQFTYPNEYKIAKDAFKEPLPSLTDIERNFSLYLINIDPIIDYPVPLIPSIVPVGGLHIKPPRSLSQDLQKVFDKAHHGVIFFSLGTNVRPSVFTDNDVNTFLNVFSKLKQTVIWKFDQERAKNIPNNVIINKWFPQNDILGQPKTKLFITHCGGLSTQETIYHAVPVVGIPYYIDQNANMAKILNKEIGVYINKFNFTFESVNEAIMEVLNNPKYTFNVRKLSQKFKNQINTPLDRAVFWVEHVLRYGSPKHLDLPSRDMPFYQTTDLDVILFFLSCVLLLCYTSCIVLCKCISRLTNKCKKNKKLHLN